MIEPLQSQLKEPIQSTLFERSRYIWVYFVAGRSLPTVGTAFFEANIDDMVDWPDPEATDPNFYTPTGYETTAFMDGYSSASGNTALATVSSSCKLFGRVAFRPGGFASAPWEYNNFSGEGKCVCMYSDTYQWATATNKMVEMKLRILGPARGAITYHENADYSSAAVAWTLDSPGTSQNVFLDEGEYSDFYLYAPGTTSNGLHRTIAGQTLMEHRSWLLYWPHRDVGNLNWPIQANGDWFYTT